MKKYALICGITVPAAILLCGCKDYHPTNSPRATATMKSNFLEVVTTTETTRADTYYEYISSMREAAMEDGSMTSPGAGSTSVIGGMLRDTAVQRNTETVRPAETAVTAPPDMVSAPRETAVTRPMYTTAEDAELSSAGTSSGGSVTERETVTSSRLEPVTAPPFDLSDIPPVPSANVKPDTKPSSPVMGQ